jgi:hypothetical protein
MLSIKQLNKKASDIKLVSLYSTIKTMNGPINIRSYGFTQCNVVGLLLRFDEESWLRPQGDCIWCRLDSESLWNVATYQILCIM